MAELENVLERRKQAALREIEQKSWFKATAPRIQRRIRELPNYCAGFLEDLARRQTEGGGVRFINVDAVLVPDTNRIYGIFVVFRVQNLANPSSVYWYQYFSWAQGPESGSKGILLIRRDGRITHVVWSRGYSFAVGTETDDGFGGFAEPDEKGLEGMLKGLRREIEEELGMPSLRIETIISLGRDFTDRGMTNNHPNIFAAIIDGSEAKRIPSGDAANPDALELAHRIVVVPVEKLWGKDGFVARNDDGFFLACIARLVARGDLVVPW